jgi:hypothetical protein
MMQIFSPSKSSTGSTLTLKRDRFHELASPIQTSLLAIQLRISILDAGSGPQLRQDGGGQAQGNRNRSPCATLCGRCREFRPRFARCLVE